MLYEYVRSEDQAAQQSPPQVSVCINFCVNELPFLKPLLQQCALFSDDVMVLMGDRLCDGSSQKVRVFEGHFNKIYSHPSVRFLEYVVDAREWEALRAGGAALRPRAYVLNLARWTGIVAAKHDWVFLLDADEIPEGARVREWLGVAGPTLDPGHVYKLSNYWYFKSPTNQATTYEDSVMLANKRTLDKKAVFGDHERDSIPKETGAPLHHDVRGVDGLPMFHHYSWVRSKAGLETKIRISAHKDDIFSRVDEARMVDHIYKDANVNDIVHGYEYKTVENRFGLVF